MHLIILVPTDSVFMLAGVFMSCYNPMHALLIRDGDKKKLKFIRKPNGFESYDPSKIDLKFAGINSATGLPYVLKIPCGKCIGCRLDYTRSWADRMMLELSTTPDQKACFVTLTYSPENVPYCFDEDNDPDHLSPVSMSLEKRDFQLFMKRLRFYFSEKKIRFLGCGEYGSSTLRPHYHLILYGISADDFSDLRLLKINNLNQALYTSDILRDIWSNGHVSISNVSYNTCAYVARYNLKKSYGIDSKPSDFALDPFILMSRRPGIGSEYFELHPDCIQQSAIYLGLDGRSCRISIPRYFWKKFEVDNPDLCVKMKSDRMMLQRDRELQKLCQTDLGYDDLLDLENDRALSHCSVLLEERIDD